MTASWSEKRASRPRSTGCLFAFDASTKEFACRREGDSLTGALARLAPPRSRVVREHTSGLGGASVTFDYGDSNRILRNRSQLFAGAEKERGQKSTL